jgi:hypothetical protein
MYLPIICDLSQVTVGGADRRRYQIRRGVSDLGDQFGSFTQPTWREVRTSLARRISVLPGGDVPYLPTDDCTITGKAGSSTLNGLRSEINAIRSHIDDVQHAENVQRRLDRRVTATIVLVLVLEGGAAYYRLATLKK